MPESTALTDRLRVIVSRFEAVENKLCKLESQTGPFSQRSAVDILLARQLAVLQRISACEHAEASSAHSGPQHTATTPPTDKPAEAAGIVCHNKVRGKRQFDSQISPIAGQQEADVSNTQQRLSQELQSRGVTYFKFLRMPSDYYEQSLEYRRQQLGADSIQQLCKSLVLENTKAKNADPRSANAVRYFCVVIQYAAKLHAEKVRNFLHQQAGRAVGRKQFHMRLAAEEEAQQLTGYGHNAVTPIGMATPIPILLSHHVANLQPDFFWMGGGEVDLKLGMKVTEFVANYQPAVVDCTHDHDYHDEVP